jgi:hypothetical protein
LQKNLLFIVATGLTLSLTGCAPSPQASCDSYTEAVGKHLANIVNGQVDLTALMQELNSIKDGAPDEMKQLLQQDLQALVDAPTELPSNAMQFCKQFLGE